MRQKLVILFVVIFGIYAIRFCQLLYIRKIFRCMLFKIVKEFETANVKYWLDFGTLLGIYREKDVILGDGDVDVCVTNEPENLEKVRSIISRLGGKELDWGAFRIYYFYNFLHVDIYKAKIVSKDNIDYYKLPDCEINIPVDVVQPIIKKEITVGDAKIIASVPEKIQEVLMFRYGKNYMTPCQKWYYLWIDFDKLKKDLKK